MTTTTTTTNNKITSNAAQKLMLAILDHARQQIDVAASSQASPRDRKRALARVQRALAALSPSPK